MAQRVTVSLVDDLDGTSDETVSRVEFSLDGVTYEMDLSEMNATRLRNVFATYLRFARRTSGRKKIAMPGQARVRSGKSTNVSARLIREWARTEGGFELSDLGRLPGDVVEAYQRAHR